ncbi:MAG: M48 family metallopeptidase [Nitrospiria bacterium]
MNLYGTIILLAMVLQHALNVSADVLNIKALASELPEEMRGVYDVEKYRKSQDYTRVRTTFGLLSSTFSISVTLLFWFSGGFDFLDQVVRGWGLSSILSGLCYFGILGLLKGLLSLPFSAYATFVIEARFGFNKSTPAIYLMDMIKGVLLSLALGGPILAAVLAFFGSAGSDAWLYAWGLAIAYLLFIQLVAPTWIMPLFNQFKPLEAGELKEKIMALADAVHFPLKNVFVIDGSKRSSKSNAFFTGYGKNKRIALYDTLIETQSVPELVAILAHEIGHYKKKHVIQGMIFSILQIGFMLFLLSIMIGRPGLYGAFYMQTPSVYTGLIFFGMLFSPIEYFLSFCMNMLSRKNEYEADRFAVKTVGRPDTMVAALKKLAAHNLANLTPHPIYTLLNASHPPLLERIRAIRAVSPSP